MNESCLASEVFVQTDEIILCHKCDYQAEDNIDLDGHTYSEHAVENNLTCRYCENAFDTKKELMIHRKKYHIERVNVCREFSKGVCPLTDSVCWYNHQEKVNEVGTISFNCNKCDEVFSNKSEYMHHKKPKHRNYIPYCSNHLQGTCWFDETKCWFSHDNTNVSDKSENDNGKTENKEIMEKIFNMMENFTKRIMKIEERL